MDVHSMESSRRAALVKRKISLVTYQATIGRARRIAEVDRAAAAGECSHRLVQGRGEKTEQLGPAPAEAQLDSATEHAAERAEV